MYNDKRNKKLAEASKAVMAGKVKETEVQPSDQDFVDLHSIDKEKRRGSEPLTEKDVEEANEFTKAAAKAAVAGDSEFEFEGKKFPTEMDVDVAKKILGESVNLAEANTDKYMWSDINNALKAAGLDIRTILSVVSKLKGKEIKEEIDLAEVKEAKIDNYISMLKKTYNNLKTMDPNSDLWKNLNKQLSNLSDDDLKKVVDAKIKWASMMAEPMLKYGKFANLRHGGKK